MSTDPEQSDPEQSARRSSPTDREQAGGQGRSADERLADAIGRPDKIVELRDARAIRAIAHQARQQVIEALYANPGVSFTSTQLADLTGLTPSAMSYHLRALEKWGLVERDADSTDARNRPWRAAGTAIHITSDDEPGRIAQEALTREVTEGLHRRLRAIRELPRERRDRFVGVSTNSLYLDDEQIAYVDEAVVRALADLAEDGWRNTPGPGRTRVVTVWSLLPEPTPGERSLDSGS